VVFAEKQDVFAEKVRNQLLLFPEFLVNQRGNNKKSELMTKKKDIDQKFGRRKDTFFP